MIELKNIVKKYDKVILDNINITLKPNNIYCFKGISGSGKTSLLNIIAGIDKKFSGDVIINGKNLKSMSKKEFDNYFLNVGYMLQKPLLYKKLTILENLLMVENDKEKIINLANNFKIENILNKYPFQVSGGELQRASLVRTLLNDNKVLILDEATSNLDLENSIIFANYLKKINIKNKIILIATHKDIYDDICNVLFNISFGKIKIIKEIENDSGELKLKKQTKSKISIFKNAIKMRIKFNFFIKTFIILLFVALLIASSYLFNYRDAYLKRKASVTPFNVLDINGRSYNKIASEYDIDYVYDDYTYEENSQKYYSLFHKEDSMLNESNYLKVGKFPNGKEVLINEEYAQKNFGGLDYESIIGKQITVNNMAFSISGIVYDEDYPMLYLIYKDIANGNNIEPTVFVPYDIFKTFANLRSNDKIIRINVNQISRIYEKKSNLEITDFSISSKAFLMYENRVSQITTSLESFTKAFLIAEIAVVIISFFFINNDISMNLYFRQREFGYLQLFHFSKNDVNDLILIEHLVSFILLLIMSTIMYYLAIFGIKLYLKLDLILGLSKILLYQIAYIIIIYIIVYISLKKYLKKDILTLIK